MQLLGGLICSQLKLGHYFEGAGRLECQEGGQPRKGPARVVFKYLIAMQSVGFAQNSTLFSKFSFRIRSYPNENPLRTCES